MDKNFNNFVDWLLKEMNKQEVTQEELATRAGISQATVSRILNREQRDIRSGTVFKLRKALGATKKNGGDAQVDTALLRALMDIQQRLTHIESQQATRLNRIEELLQQLRDGSPLQQTGSG